MREVTQWTRRILCRLTILLAALVIPLVILGIVEWLASVALFYVDPHLSQKAAERHAFTGFASNKSQLTSEIHPLYGWVDRRVFHRSEFQFRRRLSSENLGLEKSPDVRIFVLGGSTVRAPNASASIPFYLEKHLEEKYKLDFNVLTAGTASWTSINELAFLTHKILPYFDPDAVVVFDGVNDALRAVRAGRIRERSSPDDLRYGDPAKVEPRIGKIIRQLDALQTQPSFAFNQFLYTLGLNRYFEGTRYHTGLLLGTLLGVDSLKIEDSYRKIRRFWKQYPVPKDLREHVRKHRRRWPILESVLEAQDSDWSRKQSLVFLGRMTPAKLEGFVAEYKSLAPNERRRLARKLKYALPYEEFEALPCNRVPLSTDPYTTNVKSMMAASRAPGIPVLHALQPTIVHKKHLDSVKKMEFAEYLTRTFFSTSDRYNVRKGVCWENVFRRFYRTAKRELRAGSSMFGPGAKFSDVSNLFRTTRKERFVDFLHYTKKGNEEIARRLIRELERMEVLDLDEMASKEG